MGSDAETSFRVGDVGILHVHTNYSHDGRDSVQEIRDRAVLLGLRFVGLTDHAEDFDEARYGALVAECAAASSPAIELLPGLEYRMAGRRGLHLLAIGLREFFQADAPGAFFDGVRRGDAFSVMAHPGLAGYAAPPDVAERIDAVEVWNAAYNTRYLPDPRAIDLLHRLRAGRPCMVGVAGLDQHDARNDRETRVVLTHPTATVVSALREGRFVNRGRTMSFDAVAGFGPPRLLALRLARRAFDGVERTQDRLVRGLRDLRRQRAVRGGRGGRAG